ncbi:unnamed protein product, partial [Amoebophrya sp. A120]
ACVSAPRPIEHRAPPCRSCEGARAACSLPGRLASQNEKNAIGAGSSFAPGWGIVLPTRPPDRRSVARPLCHSSHASLPSRHCWPGGQWLAQSAAARPGSSAVQTNDWPALGLGFGLGVAHTWLRAFAISVFLAPAAAFKFLQLVLVRRRFQARHTPF